MIVLAALGWMAKKEEVAAMTASAGAAVQDRVPRSAAGSAEINFRVPERYNASAILFDNLPARAERCAVTGPAGTRSYAELAGDAVRLAAGLLSLGLTRGDRVLLFLDDTPLYPAALFGAIRVGLVPLLINTQTRPDLLQFYLADSGAKAAICDAQFADRFGTDACRGTELKTLIIANGLAAPDGPAQTQAAAEWLARAPGALVAAATQRDEMAFWMYSSGSTGRPKGIVHLQHDMLFTHLSYALNLLKLREDDLCFSVPKIFFAYGLGNSITFPFCAGASSLLLPGQPKPAAVFEAIARFRPTVFFGLPTLYGALIKAPEAAAADLSSLRLAVSAAEVLSQELAAAWRSSSGLEIMEGLGSSEVLHIYLSNTQEAKKPGAAGLRVPGYEISLRGADGREVADGEEGILWVRGDSNSPCYWNRPDKTAETMHADGWICSGDRFVRDGAGFHYFRGRADDLVKISGQWVHPQEVERCLADHPQVRECAVVAVTGGDDLTRLAAFVVRPAPAPGAEATVTRALQDYVKERLLPHKYPRTIAYLDELPKTGTGKIDRQALAALARKGGG
jgi:acetyl-CoA synthetase